jgi:hypothetical protein
MVYILGKRDIHHVAFMLHGRADLVRLLNTQDSIVREAAAARRRWRHAGAGISLSRRIFWRAAPSGGHRRHRPGMRPMRKRR